MKEVRPNDLVYTPVDGVGRVLYGLGSGQVRVAFTTGQEKVLHARDLKTPTATQRREADST